MSNNNHYNITKVCMAIASSYIVTRACSAFQSHSSLILKKRSARHLPFVRSGRHNVGPFGMSFEGDQQQTTEVVQSLVDFHEGTWSGQATSFSVTHDVAAGIVQRKTSPTYQTSIKIGPHYSDDNNNNNQLDFGFTETIAWEDKISSRKVSFAKSNFDVDSVDASYSFDCTSPNLPLALIGTDKRISFGIEHCLATSDDERVRCMVYYGMDQCLARIVVCNERRIAITPQQSQSTTSSNSASSNWWAASGLQQDVDRIVDKITERVYSGNSTESVLPTIPLGDKATVSTFGIPSSSTPSYPTLTRHPISLMELSSGVWLGDSIIRDLPWIPMSPPSNGRGFGATNNNNNKIPLSSVSYNKNVWPAWSMGVQKVARQWWWDFGETVRQTTDVGKAIGAEHAAPNLSSSASNQQTGFVCVNECLSRRIPRDQRMVYMDWEGGAYVALLLGSVSIQVPRYVNFDAPPTGSSKLFFTDFCVFQHSGVPPTIDDNNSDRVVVVSDPYEVCCSQMSRLYNYQGRLRQAVTSFFTLKAFDGQ